MKLTKSQKKSVLEYLKASFEVMGQDRDPTPEDIEDAARLMFPHRPKLTLIQGGLSESV